MTNEPTRDHRGYRRATNRGVPSDSPTFTCAECGQTKPRDQFWFYKTGRPCSLCNPCRQEASRQQRSSPKPQVTLERLRELLRYDPETGIFTRLIPVGGEPAGSAAGWSMSHGYVGISIDGRKYTAHRLAWLYMTGKLPWMKLDHENGVRSDNKWSNLRHGTQAQNGQNQRRAHVDNTSGFLGVVSIRGRYVARICLNRRTYHLGTFSTADEAHAAYVAAKREMHPFGML